ncbi:MAG: AzlC family ABC transporter permease [Clostridia bacterium]|nr:AzlC family ABC transporter permease [Clostridia bacterium]
MQKNSLFLKGLKDGIPIALGYLSVSFGFGILAAAGGLSALTATVISLVNVTSAGQLAGLNIIIAAGPLIEMILSEFIINIRYALMSITLTQKLDDTFTTPRRMLCAFSMTDEIFAVASAQKGRITAKYFYGLMLLPILGWVLGTFLGATAGNILPESLKNAMGLMLYAMFIAIVLPPATKSRAVAICVSLCALLSIALRFIPLFSFISPGFSVIICAVIASVFTAWRFPIQTDKEEAHNV